jgi:hypothetical protein
VTGAGESFIQSFNVVGGSKNNSVVKLLSPDSKEQEYMYTPPSGAIAFSISLKTLQGMEGTHLITHPKYLGDPQVIMNMDAAAKMKLCFVFLEF